MKVLWDSGIALGWIKRETERMLDAELGPAGPPHPALLWNVMRASVETDVTGMGQMTCDQFAQRYLAPAAAGLANNVRGHYRFPGVQFSWKIQPDDGISPERALLELTITYIGQDGAD